MSEDVQHRGWSPPGVLHNMSSPPRTKVKLSQAPIAGRSLVFDMAHALIAQGVLLAPMPWRALGVAAAQGLARERWGGSTERLCDDLGPLLYQRAPVPDFLGGRHGALLGWTPTWEDLNREEHYALCTDLALTVAVLTRHVGDLLLLARAPDLTWERLFGAPFALDDERLADVRAETIVLPPPPSPAPQAELREGPR